MFTIRNEDHMKDAVTRLTHYMTTYDKQYGYEKYNARTYIDDVLYGLGISIDDTKYKYATGFKLFKQDLSLYYGEDDSFETINTLLDKIEELEGIIEDATLESKYE